HSNPEADAPRSPSCAQGVCGQPAMDGRRPAPGARTRIEPGEHTPCVQDGPRDPTARSLFSGKAAAASQRTHTLRVEPPVHVRTPASIRRDAQGFPRHPAIPGSKKKTAPLFPEAPFVLRMVAGVGFEPTTFGL